MSRSARQADAVFVGSVTEVAGHNLFEVRASDIYKGSPGAFLTVRTGPPNPNVIIEDSVNLQVDKQYLFFLVRRGGDWTAPGCLGTREISSRLIARADRALGPATPLRAPATPESGPSESPSTTAGSGPDTVRSAADDGDDSSTWVWVGGGVALLAGAGVVAAATRWRGWR